MFKKFVSWLAKPFPFFETLKEKLILPVYIGLLVALILILFNPSNNSDNLNLQILKIVFYAVIAFSVSAGFNIILPLIFKSFFDIERWTVWKIILFTILKVLAIGVTNAVFVFYFDNLGGNIHFFNLLWRVLLSTLTVAVIPVFGLFFFLEKFFFTKHYRIAAAADIRITDLNAKETTNEFFVYDNFKITLDKLYYVKSEGNYSSFFYQNDETVNKKLIRITLKEIEDRIQQNSFVRCHKSYIVNLNKVRKVEGNARTYNFFLDEPGMVIPVSRNFPKSFVSHVF